MTKMNDLEIVILCGSPAAGKSTFYWTYLRPLGYERVNQDTLKTVSSPFPVVCACLETANAMC